MQGEPGTECDEVNFSPTPHKHIVAAFCFLSRTWRSRKARSDRLLQFDRLGNLADVFLVSPQYQVIILVSRNLHGLGEMDDQTCLALHRLRLIGRGQDQARLLALHLQGFDGRLRAVGLQFVIGITLSDLINCSARARDGTQLKKTIGASIFPVIPCHRLPIRGVSQGDPESWIGIGCPGNARGEKRRRCWLQGRHRGCRRCGCRCPRPRRNRRRRSGWPRRDRRSARHCYQQ